MLVRPFDIKKYLRRASISIAYLALGISIFLIFFATVLSLANIKQVRDAVIKQMERHLSQGGKNVKILGVKGFVPFSFTLDTFEYSDSVNAIVLKNFEMKMAVDFYKKAIVVKILTCDDITIKTKLNEKSQGSHSENSLWKLIGVLSERVILEKLEIRKIKLGSPEQDLICGYSFKFSHTREKGHHVILRLQHDKFDDEVKINAIFERNNIEDLFISVCLVKEGPVAQLLGINDDLRLIVKSSALLRGKYDIDLELRDKIQADGAIYVDRVQELRLLDQVKRSLQDPKIGFFVFLNFRMNEADLKAMGIDPCYGLEAFVYTSKSDGLKIFSLITSFDSQGIIEAGNVEDYGKRWLEYSVEIGEKHIKVGDFSFDTPFKLQGRIWPDGSSTKAKIYAATKGVSSTFCEIIDVTSEMAIQRDKHGCYLINIHSLKGKGKCAFKHEVTHDIHIEGEMRLSGNVLTVVNAKFVCGEILSEAKGAITFEPFDLNFTAHMSSKNSYFLNSFMTIESPYADIHGSIRSREDNPLLFDLKFRLGGLKQGIFVGPGLRGTQEVSGSFKGGLSSGKLFLHEFKVNSPILDADFEGLVSLSGEGHRIKGDVHVKDKRLSAMPEVYLEDLKLAVTLTGLSNNLKLSSNVKISGSVWRNPFRVLDGRAELLKGEVLTKGDFRFNGEVKGVSVVVLGDLDYRNSERWKAQLEAHFMDTHLAAHLKRDRFYEGRSDIVTKNIAQFGSLLKMDMKGEAKCELVLAEQENLEEVKILLNLNNTQFGQVRISNLKGEGIIGLDKGKNSELSAELKNINIANMPIGDGTIFIKQTSKEMDVSLKTKGGVQLKTANAWVVFMDSEKTKTIELRNLECEFGDVTVRLTKSVQISLDGDNLNLSELALDIGEGKLVMDGNISGDIVKGRVFLQRIPLYPLSRFMGFEGNGLADGNITVSGSVSTPEIDGEFSLGRLKIIELSELPYYGAKARIRIKDKNMESVLSIFKEERKVLEVTVLLPLSISLRPYEVIFDPMSDMRVYVKGELKVEELGVFELLPTKSIEGGFITDMEFKGSKGDFALNGIAQVKNFQISDIKNGIYLKDINSVIKLSGKELKIDKLEIKDLSGGSLEGSGSVSIKDFANPDIYFSFIVKKFQLLSREDVSLKASGEGKLEGSIRQANLRATLNIDSLLVDLGKISKGKTQDIPVIEVRETKSTVSKSKADVNLPIPFLGMDIIAKAEKSVIIRSKDLKSVWNGVVTVSGTASKPEINGEMDLENGYYMFLGKKFVFTSGRLVFQEGAGLKPYLVATAQAGPEGQRAIAQLFGPLDSLELKLSSDSGLPPAEAFSKALFGKEIGRLTPVQGMRLMEMTSGGKAKVPFLGLTTLPERLFGLDTWEVGSGEDVGNLKAGKYLRDNIYMELDWGAWSQQGRASVTMELTPNIELRTHMGEKGAGAELNFKWDY